MSWRPFWIYASLFVVFIITLSVVLWLTVPPIPGRDQLILLVSGLLAALFSYLLTRKLLSL